MIIVTGGAGFIGANLIKSLNEKGHNDILLVDNLTNVEKIPNLNSLEISDYMDKHEFIEHLQNGTNFGNIKTVFHQGACSDTMADDGEYVMRNNFTYSKLLYHFCVNNTANFIYASSASVYGDNKNFVESPQNEKALNAYAFSKLFFDNYMRQHHFNSINRSDIQVVGLRYFNVYGPLEAHKGRMASVAFHFFNQLNEQGFVNLFEGTDGYENGAQIRDFVYVKDVVDVNLHFFENPDKSGIFNVGTGKGQTFNDVALAVVNTWRQQNGDSSITLDMAVAEKLIRYIPMPEKLLGKYQSYTQANLTKLNDEAGYHKVFHDVESGVKDYINVRLKVG